MRSIINNTLVSRNIYQNLLLLSIDVNREHGRDNRSRVLSWRGGLFSLQLLDLGVEGGQLGPEERRVPQARTI